RQEAAAQQESRAESLSRQRWADALAQIAASERSRPAEPPAASGERPAPAPAAAAAPSFIDRYQAPLQLTPEQAKALLASVDRERAAISRAPDKAGPDAAAELRRIRASSDEQARALLAKDQFANYVILRRFIAPAPGQANLP